MPCSWNLLLYCLLSGKEPLPWQRRWQLAIDVGSGLTYLHAQKILHRDLKSLNILLDHNGRTKITDFGLARLRQQSKTLYTKNIKGSIPWMAPELFGRRALLTPKGDVYAFAMVLWEIASRELPFSDALDPGLIPVWVSKGEREDIPKGCPEAYSKVIQACWMQKPEKRLTAKKALLSLQNARPTPKSVAVEKWQCLNTLMGHTHRIHSLVQLASGRIASGSANGTIKIWDVDSGKCIKTIRGHNDPIYTLARLPNECFASGSADETIKIWDATNVKCLKTLKGHSEWVTSLLPFSDGRLVSGSTDKTIKIWEVKTGKCLKTLTGHSGYVSALIRLSNGRLASGSTDKTIKIWDVTTNKCVKTLTDHNGYVSGLTQLLSDEHFASTSYDKMIKIWNMKTGKCLKTLTGHSNPVYTLLCLSNGHLASGAFDNTIKLWGKP